MVLLHKKKEEKCIKEFLIVYKGNLRKRKSFLMLLAKFISYEAKRSNKVVDYTKGS